MDARTCIQSDTLISDDCAFKGSGGPEGRGAPYLPKDIVVESSVDDIDLRRGVACECAADLKDGIRVVGPLKVDSQVAGQEGRRRVVIYAGKENKSTEVLPCEVLSVGQLSERIVPIERLCLGQYGFTVVEVLGAVDHYSRGKSGNGGSGRNA